MGTQRDRQLLFRISDAADVLGVSESQIRNWVRDGKLKTIKLENLRAVRFDAEEVRALAKRFISRGASQEPAA